MSAEHVTKNFTKKEMRSRDGTLIWTAASRRHANLLQEFRNWYNRPMPVNSWCRSVRDNKRVGGATNSQHLLGTATDVRLPFAFRLYSRARKQQYLNNCKVKWYAICKAHGLGGGVGFYNTFIHLDSRPGSPAFWDER